MLKPKVGDMVRLKPFPVVSSDRNGFNVDAIQWQLNFDQIEEILPRPPAVGDLVKRPYEVGPTGTIIAVDEDHVWIKRSGGFHESRLAENIERIDEPS